MRRKVLCISVLLVVAPALGLAATQAVGAAEGAKSATAAPVHPKRHVVRRGQGYGFLPGYRPPEQIEWEDSVAAWRRGPAYWYGYPRFYHNQWNGGGFGPCWTQTPIGNFWNCGR